MRNWLWLALATGALQAAVIRGTVVENQTGRPLARALVVVQPVPGTPGQTLSARTNLYGAFEFPPMAGGACLVTASRRSFAAVQYGQKQWKSAGVPIVLEESASTYLSIRLPRFGSVAGTVVDENDVGLPEHDVVVYSNTRPPKLVGRAKTDDRGMYRVFGLEPGSYLVRTLGKQYEEGSYLPTFSRESATVELAHPVEANLDQQTDDVNVRPAPGRLYSVSGQAVAPMPTQATVMLVSDMGTETTVADGSGNFQFNPMAPGKYELYAQAAADRRTGGMLAGFQTLELDHDRGDVRISLLTQPGVEFFFEDSKGRPVDSRPLQVMARRKDLSGDGKPETLRLSNNRARLLPGRWELALSPMPDYYVAGFSDFRPQGLERGRPDGWNEIVLTSSFNSVKFVLSPSPGMVHGTVRGPGHDTVAGAPVFLEAYDVEARRRLTDVRAARTDMHGQFQFDGLAPGTYRVLSTFEFQMPDAAAMSNAGAKIVNVEEGHDSGVELELYVIR